MEERDREGRWGHPGGGGSSLGSCSEADGLHESQDVMVYSAQEWGVVDKVRLALTTALSLIYSCAGRQHCPQGGVFEHVCVRICINVDQGVYCLAACLKPLRVAPQNTTCTWSSFTQMSGGRNPSPRWTHTKNTRQLAATPSRHCLHVKLILMKSLMKSQWKNTFELPRLKLSHRFFKTVFHWMDVES